MNKIEPIIDLLFTLFMHMQPIAFPVFSVLVNGTTIHPPPCVSLTPEGTLGIPLSITPP